MLVAELTIQTLPGRAPSVETQLGRIPGMSRLRLDGDQRVHATWCLPDSGTAEGIAEALGALNPDILGVYPVIQGLAEA